SLLTGSFDNTARLWEAATGKPLGPPLVHQGPVVAVAFCPDGKTVLTGSRDATARLWDALTGKPLGTPFAHQNWVVSVAVRPDGKTVLTGSEDKTARLWPVPQPLQADPERIEVWVQVITGMELDAGGAVRVLDAEEWHQRKQRLEALGGPPR